MIRRTVLALGLYLMLTGPVAAQARPQPEAGNGLADATLLIVRHAEKPATGRGLTVEGEKRAKAYADYFRHFEIDGAKVRIDTLVATVDTPRSERPRLTLEPLSHSTGLPIQQPCADADVQGMAHWLAAQPPGRTTLIAWHHGKLPGLIAALGGDPARWLPDGAWPSGIFSWVVVMRYDGQGRLVYQNLVHEPEALNR